MDGDVRALTKEHPRRVRVVFVALDRGLARGATRPLCCRLGRPKLLSYLLDDHFHWVFDATGNQLSLALVNVELFDKLVSLRDLETGRHWGRVM